MSLAGSAGYDSILVATGAKSKDSVLRGLGFNLGPTNADGPNCIAVVAHFEFTGEWRTRVHVCMCAYVHVCMCACVRVCACACVHFEFKGK